jgi:predicted RNA-binding protein with EMAP domain
MDGQSLFNLVVGIAAFFGGWTLNNITRMLNRIDEDIREIPYLYVSKDDYKTDIAEIKGMLGKIFDRLENKADKS